MTVLESQSRDIGNIKVMAVPSIPVEEGIFQTEKIYPQKKDRVDQLQEQDVYYPRILAEAGVVGFLRDTRIAQIKIFPLQYNSLQKSLRIHDYIKLSIEVQGTAESTVKTARFQPTSEFFNTILKASVINPQRLQNRKMAASSVDISSRPTISTGEPAFKIKVREDSIYKIKRADLPGVNLPSIIDVRSIKLSNQGRMVPIYITGASDGRFDEDDAIYFRGEFNGGETTYYSPYTRTNIYWLTFEENGGMRMVEGDGGLYEANAERVTSYTEKLHLEEDIEFDRLLLISDEKADHWFWQRLIAGYTTDYRFQLEQPNASDSVVVRVGLMGWTHPSVYPDHHTVIRLNGNVIADTLWDGQYALILNNLLTPGNWLLDGENVLSVELPGDSPAGEVDQQFFNWFEIEYTRPLQAIDDYIEFEAPFMDKVQQFEISGFSKKNISIWDSHGRRFSNFEVQSKDGSYTVLFQDASAVPTKYFVFTETMIKAPHQIVEDMPSSLKSPANGADYILITHLEFRQSAEVLANHRQGQGLRVKVVEVEDIYDEFGHGIYGPKPIREFLKYAYDNWQPPAPTFVLLMGDTHWGYEKEVARGWGKPSFIPSYMAYTISWGLISADNYYAAISGDDIIPDLFIGRLPVNSAEEAQVVVEKIISYEANPNFGEWRRRIAQSVGGLDFFEYHADVISSTFVPKGFDMSRLSVDPSSEYFGTTEELVKLFNDGLVLFSYIGHGAGSQFEAELLLVEDIVRLNNSNKLPIALSWACFTGAFDNLNSPALGEELVRSAGRGAIAHFGAAGRAWLYGDFLCNQELFKSLLLRKRRFLGQVTTEAKIGLLSDYGGYWDMVLMYNLLGDPALKIGLPEKEVVLKVANPSLQPGENLQVSGTVKGVSEGSVKFSVYNTDDSLLVSTSGQVSGGRFDATIPIPTDMAAGNARLKAYFWNENTDGMGWTDFAIGQAFFGDIRTKPEQPRHGDSVSIYTRIQTGSNQTGKVEDVGCLWSLNQSQWDTLSMVDLGDNIFTTEQTINIYENTTVYFKFVIADENSGYEIESQTFSFKVPFRADLAVKNEIVSVTGSEDLALATEMLNQGETTAENFLVRIVVTPTGDTTAFMQKDYQVESLTSDSTLSIQIPWAAQVGGDYTVKVWLDPTNKVDERREYNNIVVKRIRLVTPQNGTNGPVASEDGNFSVQFSAGAVSTAAAFEILRHDIFEEGESNLVNRGLQTVKLANRQWASYEISMSNAVHEFNSPITVSLNYDSNDPAVQDLVKNGTLKLYAMDASTDTWIVESTRVDKSNASAWADSIIVPAQYALFGQLDHEPPKVSIRMPDQAFVDGDIVPSNPTITAEIQDNSGVDISRRGVIIILDDQVVPADEYTVAQNPTLNKIAFINFSPKLESGTHDLSIRAADAHGNLASAETYFYVAGEFSLLAIANHPNPFEDETIIAYTLSDVAEKVELKIYTSAGRLIRKYEFYDEVGYVEHVWDGLDEFGDEIANGLYYLRFTAKKGEKNMTKVQKLAKLK